MIKTSTVSFLLAVAALCIVGAGGEALARDVSQGVVGADLRGSSKAGSELNRPDDLQLDEETEEARRLGLYYSFYYGTGYYTNYGYACILFSHTSRPQ